MSYEIYLDEKLLFYPGDEECVILDSKAELALNSAGSFSCLVPPTNPLYSEIQNGWSMVTVLKDGKEIFCGEVAESEKNYYGMKDLYAAGELDFLKASIQDPAEYHDLTPQQMLETFLNIHNSQVEDRKKFYVGIVTIHDSNDSLYRYTNYENTLDAIMDKLVGRLGGYLRIRKVDGERYLDWITLEEYGQHIEQPICFGDNLLDYTENTSALQLYTACIPLGARLEDSPIEALEAYTDITSVNDGKNYIYLKDAVDRFGWKKTVVHFDDVTIPENLKEKGEEWLKENQYETMVLNLTALDLSELQSEYDSFFIGDYAKVIAEVFGIDKYFPVQSMTIYFQNPDQNKLQVGDTQIKTYVDGVADSQKRANQLQQENVRQTTAWFQSAIDNATAMMTGSKGGYKITEYDEEGKWLRDLYMNAPSKKDATLVMQVNMNGIGFSRDGFDGPYKNAWTIDGVILGEFIKAGSVTAEKLSAEYKTSVTDEIDTTVTAKFAVAEDLIQAEVTRATGVEVDLAASLKVASDLVETKVSKGEFGSYMQQYYDRVLIGFNDASKYVQITAGAISIYDNGVSDSKKRSTFDENGNHFYRDGYYVGKIGTNQWASNNSHKGLVFDLEVQGKYMSWAYKENSSADDYTTIWTFARSGSMYSSLGLHAGCDVDMHNYSLKNVKVQNLQAGGYKGWTGTIPIVTEIRDNGDGTIGWTYSEIDVSTGVITSAPRS